MPTVRGESAGFLKTIARTGEAAKLPFPVHPHMLRPCCARPAQQPDDAMRRPSNRGLRSSSLGIGNLAHSEPLPGNQVPISIIKWPASSSLTLNCGGTSMNGTLHHPLIILHHAGEMDAAKINEMFRQKKAQLAKAERDGDWPKYIWLHERPYRLRPLRKALCRINDPACAASLVSEIWSDSESIRHDRAIWIVWKALSNPRLSMSEEEREAFAALPEELCVFRGYSRYRLRTARGLSWTLDRAKAEWFARRFSFRSRGYVATGCVPKSKVLAYFDGRQEREIVVLPEDLRRIVITELVNGT
jgi:hypothetical protein